LLFPEDWEVPSQVPLSFAGFSLSFPVVCVFFSALDFRTSLVCLLPSISLVAFYCPPYFSPEPDPPFVVAPLPGAYFLPKRQGFFFWSFRMWPVLPTADFLFPFSTPGQLSPFRPWDFFATFFANPPHQPVQVFRLSPPPPILKKPPHDALLIAHLLDQRPEVLVPPTGTLFFSTTHPHWDTLKLVEGFLRVFPRFFLSLVIFLGWAVLKPFFPSPPRSPLFARSAQNPPPKKCKGSPPTPEALVSNHPLLVLVQQNTCGSYPPCRYPTRPPFLGCTAPHHPPYGRAF